MWDNEWVAKGNLKINCRGVLSVVRQGPVELGLEV